MVDSEILIRGGDVVDGTGAPARRADVRVRADEIVAVGADLAVDGAKVIDATGAAVTPGFIDTHCHTDPQVFWDPYVDPDLLHGVTTMLVGNCSLSLYPVTDATRSDVSDLFSYIEDVPRHLFDDAVPWTWSDYAGYRDVVNETGTGINLAGLVGHSMLRLVAMGPDAWTCAATDDEIRGDGRDARAAMDEGAWGLSTSFLDVDQSGRPVPSRIAEGAEFDALFDVLEAPGRGVVEVVPDLLGPTAMDTLRDLGQRCGEAWHPDHVDRVHLRRLGAAPYAAVDRPRQRARRGRRADVPAALAAHRRHAPQLGLVDDVHVDARGLAQGGRGPRRRQAGVARDPEWRAAARAEWDRTKMAMFPIGRLDVVRIVEVVGPENERWLGRTFAEVVEERGGHPSDVLADFVLENDCRPGLVAVGMANADVEGVARDPADPRCSSARPTPARTRR